MNLGGTIRDGEKSRPSLIVSHDIICILYMIYIILCLCHIVLYIYIYLYAHSSVQKRKCIQILELMSFCLLFFFLSFLFPVASSSWKADSCSEPHADGRYAMLICRVCLGRIINQSEGRRCFRGFAEAEIAGIF